MRSAFIRIPPNGGVYHAVGAGDAGQPTRTLQDEIGLESVGLVYSPLMARRLSAFALTLVIAGASVATAVCQVMCAEHEMGATGGHRHHHSCPPAAPSGATAVNAVPHACGHQSNESVATQQVLQAMAPPAFVAAPASPFPPVDLVARIASFRHVEHSPPGILSLTAQLRL
jgi:hypothetical protein